MHLKMYAILLSLKNVHIGRASIASIYVYIRFQLSEANVLRRSIYFETSKA